MGDLVRPVGIASLFLSALLSGCIFSDESVAVPGTDVTQYPSIWDRHTLNGIPPALTALLEPGPHSALDVQEAFIDVDTSEVWEAGPSQSTVHLSYWLPNNTIDGEKVPVMAQHPLFLLRTQGSESSPTNVVGAARGEFIFDNFVPHGYAFAQVAVFGTEESSGCFDYRGAGEGLGIHTHVEWLGTQNWSNGNVGLYGKSYEGATQWEGGNDGKRVPEDNSPNVRDHRSTSPALQKRECEARSQIMP